MSNLLKKIRAIQSLYEKVENYGFHNNKSKNQVWNDFCKENPDLISTFKTCIRTSNGYLIEDVRWSKEGLSYVRGWSVFEKYDVNTLSAVFKICQVNLNEDLIFESVNMIDKWLKSNEDFNAWYSKYEVNHTELLLKRVEPRFGKTSIDFLFKNDLIFKIYY